MLFDLLKQLLFRVRKAHCEINCEMRFNTKVVNYDK